MKLRFEPDLDHQQDAVAAVCGLFQGQETSRSEFTISGDFADRLPGFQEGEIGVGNRLGLTDETAPALRPRPGHGPAICPSSLGLAAPRPPRNRATVETSHRRQPR